MIGTNKKQSTAKHSFTPANSISGSETDLSTSTENLSMEQRYVLRHTSRVEPQGQENLPEVPTNVNENQGRYGAEQRFSSNVSSDSARYTSSNRSLSEARNPIFVTQANSSSTPNRNSLKEVNSNRSSLDVSTCSYNTLIIHNDDTLYSIINREYPSSPPVVKKERPRSYGEQGMQEITEIPDDYLNQSHVLKHLANEMKIPPKARSSNVRDSGVSENSKDSKAQQKFNWIFGENDSISKMKSKSQPDLTKLSICEASLQTVDTLSKENAALKQQLLICCMKVAKTQKLEDEVSNIYRVYEELVQSCERREKLERVARMRLQENLQKVQSLNRALKDQVDVFQTQLLAPSEHQILIAQLFTQNKELLAAKERQDIELAAQQATLQEQRRHIGILDTALNNAQRNIRRLEEELRKKQMYVEKITQLCGSSQHKLNERKIRLEYESELSKDSNRSGSSTNSDSKWQLQDKSNQIRLESEQRHLEEHAMRQNVSKLSLEKTSQEADRIIAEVKHDKLRYLEEVHSAQRKVNDLQSHLKILESRLSEKDALIRTLQNQKICGLSFDSYNLSTDSFSINPLRYNSPSSFNASNNSFNTIANTSLLDPAYGGNSANYNPNVAITGALSTVNFGQSTSTYNQSVVNLQSMSAPGNYSPNSSNYSASFNVNSNYMPQASPTFNSAAYDNHYEEHMKKQIDDQISKFETLQRGLCCFPGLSNKKPNQPLLSDEISVLSTNNSDAFLQKLAQMDQRDRSRHEQDPQLNKSKTEEIILLEKQGRCSQKIRNNASGNLAQVTQNVGQNMTDISNIGNFPLQGTNNIALPSRKERGKSLQPSALPRPPRNSKTLRKIDYDRLSETEQKQRSETPPKPSFQKNFDMKSAALKIDFSGNSYCPVNGGDCLPKTEAAYKRKDYGTMRTTDTMKFGFKNNTEFSRPDYSSTNKYQRLEDSPKSIKPTESITLKRSLLPSSKKLNVFPTNANNMAKNLRDSINSNSSNTSNQLAASSHMSTLHLKSDSNSSHMALRANSKTPPKLFQYNSHSTAPPAHLTKLQQSKCTSSLPVPNSSAPLPPKPVDNKTTRKGNSLSRNGENRYRIQF